MVVGEWQVFYACHFSGNWIFNGVSYLLPLRRRFTFAAPKARQLELRLSEPADAP